jgi:hypothetical protein
MYASPASLFSLPPPSRRGTRGKFAPAERGRMLVMLHMFYFTYEDYIKIKNKHVAGISRTFFIYP